MLVVLNSNHARDSLVVLFCQDWEKQVSVVDQ